MKRSADQLAEQLGLTAWDSDLLAGAALKRIKALEEENDRLRRGFVRIADAHTKLGVAMNDVATELGV